MKQCLITLMLCLVALSEGTIAASICPGGNLEQGGLVHSMTFDQELFAILHPIQPETMALPPIGGLHHAFSSRWIRSNQASGLMDINRDGLLDKVCITTHKSAPGALHEVYFASQHNQWPHEPSLSIHTNTGSWRDDDYVDVNNDGCPDLIRSSASSYGLFGLRALTTVRLKLCLPNQAAYTEDYIQSIRQKGAFSSRQHVGDLNGDKLPELIFVDIHSGAITVSGLVADYLKGGLRCTLRVHKGQEGRLPFAKKATSEITLHLQAMSLPQVAIEQRDDLLAVVTVKQEGSKEIIIAFTDGRLQPVRLH